MSIFPSFVFLVSNSSRLGVWEHYFVREDVAVTVGIWLKVSEEGERGEKGRR